MPKGVWAVPAATAVAPVHPFPSLVFQPGELLRRTAPKNLLSDFLGKVAELLPGAAAPGNILILQGMDDPVGIVHDDPREGTIMRQPLGDSMFLSYEVARANPRGPPLN